MKKKGFFFFVQSGIRTFRTLILQRLWNVITFENRDCYDIGYYWHGSFYKIRVFKPKPLPPSRYKVLFEILDEHDVDVSITLLPYLGPKYDFHGFHYCPLDFGYSRLTFFWTDGSIQRFDLKEKLIL